MDTWCNSCRLDTAGQHEASCPLYEGVTIVKHTRPTLWLQPCYGCKERDATVAALREALARNHRRFVHGIGQPDICDDCRALLAPAPEGAKHRADCVCTACAQAPRHA